MDGVDGNELEDVHSAWIPPGIPVIVARRPAASVTTIACTLRFGSRHDPPEQAGLAHVLEHLMLRQSARPRDLTAAIGRLGGEVNAITSKEEIFFYCRVPPAETLAAVGMVADWAADPTLPLHELENEKRVIVEELRSHDSDPAEAVYDVLHAALFPSGGLGQPTGGAVVSVESLDAEVIASAHVERVHPGTLGFVVVGPADPPEVVDRVLGSAVSRLSIRDWRPDRRRDARPSPRPTPTPAIVAIPSDYAYVGLAVEACSYSDDECPAAEVLAALLGGPPSSLLFRVLRSERGLAYSVGAWHRPFTDAGVLRVEIGTSPANAIAVHDSLRELVAQAVDSGWPGDQVEHAKRWHIGQVSFEAERSVDEAFLLSRLRLVGGLENWTLSDDLARIRSVTPAQVNDLSARLFRDGCVSAVVGGSAT